MDHGTSFAKVEMYILKSLILFLAPRKYKLEMYYDPVN